VNAVLWFQLGYARSAWGQPGGQPDPRRVRQGVEGALPEEIFAVGHPQNHV